MGLRGTRHPIAALRRAVVRTVTERKLPPYVVDYVRGRGEVAASRVAGAVNPLVSAPGRALAHRRLRHLLDVGLDGRCRRAVRVDGGWRVTVEYPGGPVAGIVERNAELVLEALRAGGLDACRTTAGVSLPADQRVAALDALVAYAAPNVPLYVTPDPSSSPVPIARLGAAQRAGLLQAPAWLVLRYYRLSDRFVVGVDQACRVDVEEAAESARTPRKGPGREVDFPVDVVYTWVDGSDPAWQVGYEEARREHAATRRHDLAANRSRYRDHDELRFSLRSLELYAPWVRRVFLVTCGQVPRWLEPAHERLTLVRHDDILDPECLPTFSSHAIETALHRIDGLSEQYLYLNDDVFFGRPVLPELFFLHDGTPRCFPDPTAPIPAGPAAVTDAPVDAAAKNVRDLIREHHGFEAPAKMLHVVHPQRRSILGELERVFSEELERTSANRFRDPSDVSVASCLSHWYGVASRQAVEGAIAAEYVNVADRWAPVKLHRLLRDRSCDVFCVNETDVPERRLRRVERMVTRFLTEYFPLASRFEIPGAGCTAVPSPSR